MCSADVRILYIEKSLLASSRIFWKISSVFISGIGMRGTWLWWGFAKLPPSYGFWSLGSAREGSAGVFRLIWN